MDNIIFPLSFNRALYSLYSSYSLQSYFGIVLYLFLAIALCSLLATLAYLSSLSSVQDSEKRSEYECGFEPFDSATRLPFDVHFYLVGILFLIFDVEISLLFPWALSLRTSGWFGFYLMLGFIFILAVGFLYEWKRGALIWPSRQQELPYVFESKSSGLSEIFAALYFVAALCYADPDFFGVFFHAFFSYFVLIFAALFVFGKGVAALGRQFYALATQLKCFDALIRRVKSSRLSSSIIRFSQAWSNRRLANPLDYAKAALVIEIRLAFYQKRVNLLLAEANNLAAECRAIDFHNEQVTPLEKKAYDAIAKHTKTYQLASDKYRSFYKRFAASASGKDKSQRRNYFAMHFVKTLRQYLYFQATRISVFRRKDQLIVDRLRQDIHYYVRQNLRPRKTLRSTFHDSSPSASVRLHDLSARSRFACAKLLLAQGRLESLRTQRALRVDKNAAGPDSTPTKKALALPFLLIIAPEVSYFNQFFVDFLPEMILTLMITAILAQVAIALGQGQSKKALAMASLVAFRQGLTFVIALYLLQLLTVSSHSFFNGYAITSDYVIGLKLLVAYSGRFILSESTLYLKSHSRHLLEYPVAMTLAILFMLLLVGSGHLVSSFLALVGFSLNLYVLILFDATSTIAREAGIKYFYLSAMSSGLMLYGIFLIFLILGTGHFYEINQILSTEFALAGLSGGLLQIAIVFLLIGLFFKLSAFPGHLWAADVYEGSPDPVTAFFMLPVKIAVLSFVIQLLSVAFEPAVAYWQPLLLVSAITSLVWGCLGALSEYKTKRFLAYASINQIGFLLVGLASASFEGYRTTLFYLLIYVIMNVGFLTIFLTARRDSSSSLLYLSDFRGFGTHYKTYSWSVAIILLSMAGIPPLAGFFGKYYLLLHAQEQGFFGLVIAGLATSLVSAYYYLRLIKTFWFEGTSGMTSVNCELSKMQYWNVNLSEWFLWLFILYAGTALLFIDGALYETFGDIDLLATVEPRFANVVPSSEDDKAVYKTITYKVRYNVVGEVGEPVVITSPSKPIFFGLVVGRK